VLDAIYAAYGTGWDDLAGRDPMRRELTSEAIWLARVIAGLLPNEPEALGLLALLLYCEARRPARLGPSGDYVPISAQDITLWSEPLIAESDALLATAAQARRPGRFQLEASIQSAHVDRLRGRAVDWEAIATLYEGLVRIAATAGALVGRAAAVAEARGAEAGLRLLEQVPDEARVYQPYWAVRAHLLQCLGRHADALDAFDRALGMTQDESVRTFLRRRRERVVVDG
jgi:predicted RNA polymerase sigma factor